MTVSHPRSVLLRALVAVLLAAVLRKGAVIARADELKIATVFPAGVPAGETSELQIESPSRWPVEVESTVKKLEWKATDKKGVLEVHVPADVPPQLAWFRLYDAQGVSPWQPLLISANPREVEKEPNDRPSQAHACSLPAIVDGRLGKRGDVDVFRVHLNRGDTLVARVTAHHLLGSPIDSVLQLCDSRGFVLWQNHDDRGVDPTIVFKAAADGDYLLRLFGFPSKPNSSIAFTGSSACRYVLALSTHGAIDGWTGPTEEIFGDGPITLQATGWNLRTPVHFSVDHLPNVHGSIAAWRWIGARRLLGQAPLPLLSHGDVMASERQVAGGQPLLRLPEGSGRCWVSGAFEEAGEVDTYRFESEAGQTWEWEIWSDRLGYRADPWLEIVDASNKRVAQFDDLARDATDVRLRWKAPAKGTYRVQVRDRFSGYGLRWRYWLSARRVLADLTVKIDKLGWEAKSGQTVRLETEWKWESGTPTLFRFRVVGLPERFSVGPVEPAKGKGGKTTLEIRMPEDAAGGFPFAIEAIDEQERVIARARWTGAPLFSPADRLWLTVTNP